MNENGFREACGSLALTIHITFIVITLNKNTPRLALKYPVPEFIDPVFTKTRPKHSFLVIENTRFELVFGETGFINSGTGSFKANRVAEQKLSLKQVVKVW
jgi:hypothetical protein